MIENDNIQDLLREKLQSHEVTPSDAVWKNVSSSLSSTATSSAAAGSSILFKAAVAVIGVSGLGIATYFILQDDTAVVESAKITSIKADNKEESIKEIEKTEIALEENDEAFIENNNESQIENTTVEEVAVVLSGPSEEIDFNPISNDVQDASVVQNTIPQTNELAESSINTDTPVEEPLIVSEDATAIEEETIEEETIEEETVETEERIEDVEENISLPNIFTPNNDGANDFFSIEMSDKLDFQIVVIDQTNTVVFQSNDKNFRWDGTMMSGEPAPSGNYVYFLSAKTMSGKDFVKSSKLRIQR